MEQGTALAAEPWMRGTHTELDTLRRGVVHALELAQEDAIRWTADLDDVEIEAEPHGLPSVGWQLRHMARALDRLLTYAEDRMLDELQLAALASERSGNTASERSGNTAVETRFEFHQGIERAIVRVRAIAPALYEVPRGIGRKRLPTTVGGLLVHCAEHTQRHAGQMITTVKLLR